MKKAILFGANGYLGRHIAVFLEQYEISFIPLGSSENSKDYYDNYQAIDVTKRLEVESLDFEVDFIFVFSGLTGTEAGFDKYYDFLNVNEIGLLHILNHHKNCKSDARIIFPSTRLVYKGAKDIPLSENAEKEAKTIYAQNKLACEEYLRMYNNCFDIEYTIFRICVPYGNLIDESYSYGTLGFFLDKAISDKQITLYGDGQLKRTFSHVGDIANSILKAISLEATKNKVYNIGSNDDLSLLNVANLVAQKYEAKVKHMPWPNNALKIESGDTIFDGSKLQDTIQYRYQFSLENWIDGI